MIDVVIDSEFCRRLGSALLHSIWIVTLSAAVGLLIIQRFRSNASLAYTAGMASMILSFAIMCCWFALAPIPANQTTDTSATPRIPDLPGSQTSGPGDLTAPRDAMEVNPRSSGPELSATEPGLVPNSDQSTIAKSAKLKPEPVTDGKRRATSLAVYAAWLTPLWVLGVVFCSVRWLFGFSESRKLTRSSVPAEKQLIARLQQMSHQMGVTARIQLLVSDRIRTPMVIGILRASIIVPVSLITQLSPDQWNAILAHELAHIRRRDAAFNLLQILIETVFFYHPLVWVLGRKIRLARECCCDQMATATTGQPVALAEALFLIEKKSTAGSPENYSSQLTGMMAAVGDGSNSMTLTRIRLLLSAPVDADRNIRGSAGAALMLGLLILILLGWSGLLHQDGFAEESPRAAIEAVILTGKQNGIADQAHGTEAVKHDKTSPEPWELSKRYDAALLRYRYLMHEAPPVRIQVPLIRGQVFRPDSSPLPNAIVASHTPRQWLRLKVPMQKEVQSRTADAAGRFGIPKRGEPYRVLVTDKSGVASMSHEELIHSDGEIHLKPWAAARGSFILNGKPQAGQKVILRFNTLGWSYSRGGPRLTTDYSTVTDKNGRFEFERVPPLPGSAYVHDGPLQRSIPFACKSGETITIDFGKGVNVAGVLPPDVLNAIEQFDPQKCTVNLSPERLPIPYPDELGSDETKRFAWREKWSQTAEGFELNDRNFILINTNIYGKISADGRYSIAGIPAGDYTLTIRHNREPIFDRHIRVGQEDVEVSAKSPRPNLRVKVVDSLGRAVANALVAVYDRNNFRAGRPVEFERFTSTTDQSGWADLGVLPQDYVCVEVSPRRKDLDSSYAVIYRDKRFRQTKPARYNVDITETPPESNAKPLELELKFTMRKGVDIDFTVVDTDSGESIFWPEIYFQDKQATWWNFTLIDGGGQYDFVPVGPEIGDADLIVTARGYFSQQFRFDEELTTDRAHKQLLKLQKAPGLRLRIRTPNGEPAAEAQLKWVSLESGLTSTSVLESRVGADGNIVIEFPPGGEYLRLDVNHADGKASIRIGELKLRESKRDGTFEIPVKLAAQPVESPN